MEGGVGGEPGASHARAACVSRANGDGQIRYHFAKARWSGANVKGEVM